ncbi:hypothetical protein BpHYR1_028792 [Brachionus plicatilis]|uniref:Uncharacterized protein n=1 Tax=Brachionus plicatilis TaxID=10195 RepID=A0A3M7RCJ8_BRAPC|nr:hypothetical protein BpHYR1_028792 [Brachionus plicatilis]
MHEDVHRIVIRKYFSSACMTLAMRIHRKTAKQLQDSSVLKPFRSCFLYISCTNLINKNEPILHSQSEIVSHTSREAKAPIPLAEAQNISNKENLKRGVQFILRNELFQIFMQYETHTIFVTVYDNRVKQVVKNSDCFRKNKPRLNEIISLI